MKKTYYKNEEEIEEEEKVEKVNKIEKIEKSEEFFGVEKQKNNKIR